MDTQTEEWTFPSAYGVGATSYGEAGYSTDRTESQPHHMKLYIREGEGLGASFSITQYGMFST